MFSDQKAPGGTELAVSREGEMVMLGHLACFFSSMRPLLKIFILLNQKG